MQVLLHKLSFFKRGTGFILLSLGFAISANAQDLDQDQSQSKTYKCEKVSKVESDTCQDQVVPNPQVGAPGKSFKTPKCSKTYVEAPIQQEIKDEIQEICQNVQDLVIEEDVPCPNEDQFQQDQIVIVEKGQECQQVMVEQDAPCQNSQDQVQDQLNSSSSCEDQLQNNQDLQQGEEPELIDLSYHKYTCKDSRKGDLIEYVNYDSSDFCKTSFEKTTIRNTLLSNSTFFEVSFKNAILDDVDFTGSSFKDAWFNEAKLRRVNFAGASLRDVCLIGAFVWIGEDNILLDKGGKVMEKSLIETGEYVKVTKKNIVDMESVLNICRKCHH